MKIKVSDTRIEERDLQKIRKKVLQFWPTGKEVDLESAIDFHRRLPKNKITFEKLLIGKNTGKTFIQPRGGVALTDDLIKLLRALEKAGADFLPVTIDSFTRENRYDAAQEGILRSKQSPKIPVLNGYPAVNAGVKECRRIIESVNVPVEIRHGTPDARLLAEITLAAGFTDFEGGAITYVIPYSAEVPLKESIKNWQYVDRLVGLYQENGITINRESFGALTGTLVSPCIAIAIGVIEALLAAKQGVKSISLGYGQCGNLVQDIAAIKALVSLSEEYMHSFNYKDVLITTVFHQWMGGFPENEYQAAGVIALGTLVGALSKSNKIITKSIHEAIGIPNIESNVAGVKISKQIINMLDHQGAFSNSDIEQEVEIIKQETRCMIDKTMELGRGDIAKGVILAFEKGVIDIPFAPNRFNLGKILTARDNCGAIRFLKVGNLPFSKNIIDFHKAKIRERAKKEKRKANFEMVVDDIYAISEGKLIG